MTDTLPRTSRAALLRDPVLLGLGGLTAVGLLHVRDPHDPGSWGFCPSQLLFGVSCPGCGGLRAVNLLTNGDVMGALSSNALAVAIVAIGAIAWVVWFLRRARGIDAPYLSVTPKQSWVFLGVAVAFAVFRYTPWGAWFLP